jgi:4-aminobutyrate aminotransferase-like enzyme
LNPDRYRGPFGYDDANAASKYAWDVKNMIEHGTSGKVAGFIAETIQVIKMFKSNALKLTYSSCNQMHGRIGIPIITDPKKKKQFRSL